MCVFVCVLCALCPSPLHAPVRHNGPEIWEQAQAERSGNGMGQTGGTLSFLPSLSSFPFDVLWLICLLLTLPSSVHRARSAPPLFSASPACFYHCELWCSTLSTLFQLWLHLIVNAAVKRLRTTHSSAFSFHLKQCNCKSTANNPNQHKLAQINVTGYVVLLRWLSFSSAQALNTALI